MKNPNPTLYKLLERKKWRSPNRGVNISAFLVIAFFLVHFTAHAQTSGVEVVKSTPLENSISSDNIEIQQNKKGKFIEIYNSSFLEYSSEFISTKLGGVQNVKDVMVNKSENKITVYFDENFNNSDILKFTEMYFNK